ncbi:MAG: hypothetical protein EOO27_13165 [Comamonadaceae bacterium]|nr:MAG: hypothetical protein EOO27_13165 [Comamonadaceae bacterium]
MSISRARSDADWERQVWTEAHGRGAPEHSRSAPAEKPATLADHNQTIRTTHEAKAPTEEQDE